MTATVFIVHWNSPATCNTLCATLLEKEWIREIVVIDNHSKQEMVDQLLPVDGRVQILRLQENLGWGPALNRALSTWLAKKTDDFCLISAHDSVPVGDSLELLRHALQADDGLGGVCPEYGLDELPHYTSVRAMRMTPASRKEYGTVEPVTICNATLFAMRRTCLEQIGVFHEGMFAYGDEVEICLRARRQGWRLGLCWGAVVANPQTTTTSRLRTYLFTRNTLMIASSYSGLAATALRAAWMPAKAILEIVVRGDSETGRTRLWGWWDWVRGRYGRPSMEFFS